MFSPPSVLNGMAPRIAGLRIKYTTVPSIARLRKAQKRRKPKELCQRQTPTAHIIPRSKNACLQGHFCEAVNCAAAQGAEAAQAAQSCFARLTAHIIPHHAGVRNTFYPFLPPASVFPDSLRPTKNRGSLRRIPAEAPSRGLFIRLMSAGRRSGSISAVIPCTVIRGKSRSERRNVPRCLR